VKGGDAKAAIPLDELYEDLLNSNNRKATKQVWCNCTKWCIFADNVFHSSSTQMISTKQPISIEQPESTALVAFIRTTIPMPHDKALDIAEQFQPRLLKRHKYVLQEGNIGKEAFFLESGYLRAFVNDPDGNDVTISIFTPNSFVNNLVSFFRREPSEENIQAVTDCLVWAISYDALQTLFHGMPEFREFGRMMLIMNNLALKDRIVSMIRNTAEERYAALLQSKPDVFQHVPLKMIASFLGITDTSLSRIRRDFAQK